MIPLRRATTPDRPGPGPLPEGLLRALDVDVGRRMESLLAGDYRALVHGDGSELAQIRPYVPGDDVRRIDWNVTARTGEPHVREHLAERVLVTWLVLDTSPFDAVRHGGPAQGGRRRGGRRRARARGHAAGKPARRRHVRGRQSARAASQAGPPRSDRPADRAPRRAVRRPRRGDFPRRGGQARRRARAAALARRGRLGLSRSARLAPAAARARRPPRRARRRDPRPTGAGAAERWASSGSSTPRPAGSCA